jgi:tRNA(Ile)-lysidine synthase
MELLRRIRSTIRHHDLLRPTTRVVCALSGGSDSVALVHLLRTLDESGELSVAGLAHFNHQLRPAAASDERFCERLAASINCPLLVDREDVEARARRRKQSIEDAARDARYEFLERARIHFQAEVVALGHTRDDQAETFLLRLLRGAGARGLASMHPRRGHFIRPLLDCRRLELQKYLEARHHDYVVDESNDDVRIARNRVRVELLPLLERRFNPAIVDALADAAEVARAEWSWMSNLADVLDSEVGLHASTGRRFDADGLNRAPLALARIVLYKALGVASRGRPVSFQQVDAALRVCRGESGRVDGVGYAVERVGSELVVTPRPDGARGRPRTAGTEPVNLFHYPLSIPGEVELAEAQCVVSAEAVPSVPGVGALLSRAAVAVRRDLCGGSLAVRNRRPGDRFRPTGMGGRKKLQDYFVDRKVARLERDAVPLVVDESDRIVWVAGYSIDEEFRVTDPTQAVLILRLKVLGGPA